MYTNIIAKWDDIKGTVGKLIYYDGEYVPQCDYDLAVERIRRLENALTCAEVEIHRMCDNANYIATMGCNSAAYEAAMERIKKVLDGE